MSARLGTEDKAEDGSFPVICFPLCVVVVVVCASQRLFCFVFVFVVGLHLAQRSVGEEAARIERVAGQWRAF